MNLKQLPLFALLILLSCDQTGQIAKEHPYSDPYLTVLGIAQDGGFPHINNTKEFEAIARGERPKELVVSLGLIDPDSAKKYLFEATPDMPQQLDILAKEQTSENLIDGVFLTHAHIGHYTGLMHFGLEAMGAQDVPVYAMPRMEHFLKTNGPWSQLVSLKNIQLKALQQDSAIALSRKLKITPFLVPHRDEFSETVGYRIDGPNKTAVFIPDIDKWEKWDQSLVELVASVDYAFLDASFFADGEIPRPMAEIPHPFIEETVALFATTDTTQKSKIIFIHFNHSNPALDPENKDRKALEAQGFRFAGQGDKFLL